MRTGSLIAIAMVAGAKLATAAPYGQPDYTPPEHWAGGAQLEWMPAGSFVYSGLMGEIDYDVSQAYGGTAWVGYELDGGFEIGAMTRVIAGEKPVADASSATELIVAPRLGFHTRPAGMLDVSFAISPGYSHVFFPSGASLPDPSGFTVDFAAGLAYPVSGTRLWGVATFGYQRGFQHTSEMSVGPHPMMLDANFATDYGHLGLGLAYRF
jgi:hypothetical protein